jgi:hypothetical protein
MWGGRGSVVIKCVLGAIIASACATSAGASGSLASYAAGRWQCRMVISGAPIPIPPLKVVATVTAASATDGRVQMTLPSQAVAATGAQQGQMSGAWQLRGGKLLVSWDNKAEGTVTAQPVALETKQFKIRGDNPQQPGQWLHVSVNRQARTVAFAVTTPGPGALHLTCAKA